MIRFLILAGYFELTMYLQISGKLDQYINTHYAYLAYISMVLSFLLAVIQLVIWMKNLKLHSHLHGKIAKLTSPMILVIPVLVGLLVPTVTLDSTTVAAKGYNFPLAAGSAGTVSDDGTTVQYLKPDTSLYFTSSAYEKEMQKELKNTKVQANLKSQPKIIWKSWNSSISILTNLWDVRLLILDLFITSLATKAINSFSVLVSFTVLRILVFMAY